MGLTPYHAKYFAHELTRRYPSDSAEKLAGAVAKGNDSLLKVVNEVLADMQKDGSAKKLYDQWITGKK